MNVITTHTHKPWNPSEHTIHEHIDWVARVEHYSIVKCFAFGNQPWKYHAKAAIIKEMLIKHPKINDVHIHWKKPYDYTGESIITITVNNKIKAEMNVTEDVKAYWDKYMELVNQKKPWYNFWSK